MTYTYEVTQDDRGPVARVYADGVEVDAFGPFEKGADAEAQAWAEAMVAGLSDGSVSLAETTTAEDPNKVSARAKLAALGLTEEEIAALVK